MNHKLALLMIAGALAAGNGVAAEPTARADIDTRQPCGGAPHHAIIGVQLDPASGADGAKVRDVSPGGPAAEAGVKPGDVIVGVNGQQIKGESTREVIHFMRHVKPDDKVNLRVIRDGNPQDIVVIARPAIGLFNMPAPPPHSYPGMPVSMAGFEAGGPFVQWMGNEFGDMQLAMLTPELGRYFGTNEGVLVVRKPDNDAYKLEDGDVILSIDGRKPTSGSHATRIIRSYQPGDKLAMKVMRLKKPLELRITMPAGSEHPSMRRFSTEEAD